MKVPYRNAKINELYHLSSLHTEREFFVQSFWWNLSREKAKYTRGVIWASVCVVFHFAPQRKQRDKKRGRASRYGGSCGTHRERNNGRGLPWSYHLLCVRLCLYSPNAELFSTHNGRASSGCSEKYNIAERAKKWKERKSRNETVHAWESDRKPREDSSLGTLLAGNIDGLEVCFENA